jgi:hypothetical protein
VNTARLELGADVLDLTEANGWFVRQLDVGYPAVRQIVDPRAGADGTVDSTQFFGNRTVSLLLRSTGNRRVAWEQLSKFMRPGTRPFLFYNLDGADRRIRLRPVARSAAFVAPTTSQEFLVQWVAPDGVIEAATETVALADATSGVEDGRQYDLTFDRTYDPTTPAGAVLVTNDGTSNVALDIQLFGPCTDPLIENLTTGELLAFDTTLTAGQWLQISSRNRTVLLNNLPAQNRYDTLDFTVSSWFTLPPGQSLIRYRPDTSSSGAFARISFRSSWI